MSKLQDLIQELCPNGVEYKKLGDVCELSRGKVYSKEYIRDNKGEYPLYSSQTANDGELGKISTYDYDGEFLTWTTDGAYAGTIFYRVGKFSITNVCGLIKIKTKDINIRFLYFWLSLKAKDYVNQGMGNPKLMSNQIALVPIPVPPLPVQEEIVKILDRFAVYTAELQAELQARKEQYEYYRNLLLNFNHAYGAADEQQKKSVTTWGGHSYEIQWKTLGEIGKFTRGNGLQKKDFTECGVPCIHYGQIYTYYGTFATQTKSFVNQETAQKCKKAHKGDLIFATVSENIDDVCKCVTWLGEEEICISGDSLAFCHKQNPKYMAYCFQTYEFAKYKRSRVTGTKVIRLHQSQLENFLVPIPPLELQERIVAILDKFETLVNDLSQGLPAEIAAVQEQYEYYRNKLLTFKQVA